MHPSLRSSLAAAVLLTAAGLPAQFHDAFTGTKPATGWTWSDPGNDAKFQMVPALGVLRMIVPPGNDHTTGHGAPLYAGPMLTVPATGDFTITTHVTVNYPFVPTTMESGLMIWKDRSNNLQFKRTNGFASQNVLYYGNIANSRTTFHGNVKVSANALYLRIVRVGSTFTAYFGTDGRTWTKAGSVVWKVTGTLQVGIATSFWLWFGSTTKPATGDYDFFDLRLTSTETMRADRAGVSAAAGAQVPFQIGPVTGRGGSLYLMLAGFSGNSPGIPLPGGARLPVNFDALTSFSLALAGNPAVFPGSVGVLDATGRAAAKVILPAGALNGIKGRSLHFATVVFPKGGGAWLATNAANLTVRP